MTQIEKRQFLIVGGVLLIALSALIVTSLYGPSSFDTFWHLQMGKDWLLNDLSPWVDHYSFTYNAHKITNPPVIFQGLLFLLVSQYGLLIGFQIFKLGCLFLTLGAALLLLRQMKAPVIVYAVVFPMIVLLLQTRAMVRPELLSYTFSLIALWLYFRAHEQISTRNLIPMVILMWVWSAYHSSIVGYVIFFGFFIDSAWVQFKSKVPSATWLKWFAWGLLIVAVGFLNPSFSHPILQMFTFPSEWKVLIMEYLPPAPFFKSVAGIYILLLFATLAPVLAYQQRKFGLLVVWAVLIFSALTMQRMVAPSGIVIVMLTAHLVVSNEYFRSLSVTNREFRRKVFGLVVVIAVGVNVYSNIERTLFFMKRNQGFMRQFPVAMADYMSEQHMHGRIFNMYGLGGYLIYRLTPQNQVYIDGRTGILYPVEHMIRYEEIRKTSSPEVLFAELEKYSVDYIIWEYTQFKHDLVQEMGGFGLDFLDGGAVLYARGKSNFPVVGSLLSQPECWRTDMLEELNSEQQKMVEILPTKSRLFPFINLVIGYSNADDGKAFFDQTIGEMEWLDEMRRFAGYRFFEMGEYDLTAILLGGVETRKPKDYLASALAKIKTGDYELASQILEEYSSVQWRRLQPEEIYIQYKLYQMIGVQRNLTLAAQKRLDVVKKQLVELGYTDFNSDQILDSRVFCTLVHNRLD